MARDGRRGGVTLPWEQRWLWLREVLAGRRWKLVAGSVVVLGLGLAFSTRMAERERMRETNIAIADLRRAVAAFRLDEGRCPRSLREVLHPPKTGVRYLRQLPADGWGRQLHVQCPGAREPLDVDIVSAGRSGDVFVDDNVY